MTLERAEKSETWSRRAMRPQSHSAAIGSGGPASGLRHWLRLAAMRRTADAMLRRLLHRPMPTRIDELSPHLLRDLGLPPDVRR